MKFSLVRHQKGIGLVGVMVAAALVIVAALAVANFINGQTFLSKKLEVSGSCQNIANSVVEYLKKDEASLFISSFGPPPGSTYFSAGLDKTDDDMDRFVFSGVPTPFFMGPPSFQMSLPNGNQSLPNTWKYFNHLNIKNSTNRLMALAASGKFCCSSLDIKNANCGAIFVSDKLTRSGFKLAEKNVEIKLAVDFKDASGSRCKNSQQLALADLLDSKFSGTANFAVQVTAGMGTANEKKCTATGSVSQFSDVAPSLTLLELQNQPSLCGAKSGSPSACSSATNIVYKVKTVKSIAGKCESQCLSQVQSKVCSSIAPGTLSLFNTFSNANCAANCQNSEPGSAFLCKVGEKNWFNDPLNANHWEPCEIAKVYDYDNSVMPGAKVTVQYLPANNSASSEITTNATITLSGLTADRAYVLDVRALDTKGNVGPSFCNSSPSCNDTSEPHFVVMSSAPFVGTMSDSTKRVEPVTYKAQLGRDYSLTNQIKYSNALNPFLGTEYQCDAGAPLFTVPVSSPVPGGAFGGFGAGKCTATLTSPSGATVNPACICNSANCSSQLPTSAANGNYKFSMNIVNDCGGVGVTKTQDWCTDSNVTVPISNGGNKVFGPSPDFSTHVTYPTVATKACGIVSLCPAVGGGFTPTKGACPNITIKWSIMNNSGCLQDPANNYCLVALDACGRYAQTTPVKYSTTLLGVPYTSGPPNNKCFVFGGSQVCGNVCGPGSYCSATGHCFTNCATPPCPVNINTPIASNNGPMYCPTLNSCNFPIGGTPSSATCGAVLVVGACSPITNGQSFATAPTTNLCSTGTATPVLGTGPWNWTCQGSGGGTDANCSANSTVPGIWCSDGLEDAGCSNSPCPVNGSSCTPIGSGLSCKYQAGACTPTMNMVRKKICTPGPGPCPVIINKNKCPVRCPVGFVLDPTCSGYSSTPGPCHLCGPAAPICN